MTLKSKSLNVDTLDDTIIKIKVTTSSFSLWGWRIVSLPMWWVRMLLIRSLILRRVRPKFWRIRPRLKRIRSVPRWWVSKFRWSRPVLSWGRGLIYGWRYRSIPR